MRGARDRFDPGWWSGSYSSSSAAAAHGPRSCGTRMRPFQHRSMPSSLLLRVFNVVLLLSCSTAGITAHSAGVASAQADDRAQDSSAAPSASTLRSGAELAVSKGEHDKALRLFAQVIELEPKNERNFYKRFRVYLAKRKYTEAISDLSRALELKPKYKQALAQRAKLLRMVGKCEEAVRDYAALEAIDAANGDLASFYPMAKSCAERLAEAAVAESRGNWQAAADAYDAVIDEQLDLVGTALFMQRARCHFALKRWLQAAADAGRAAKLAADGDMDQGGSGARERAEALELRGRCYIQLGDFEMAANHFREVLMDDPDNGPCREEHKRCRGVVKKLEAGTKLLEAGDTDGATREWRSASTMEPDNPLFVGPLLLRIGSAHFDSKNWGEANRAARECLNVYPNGEHGVKAEIMVGDVHVETEEFQEAVHAYGRAEQKAKEMDDQELLENARQKLKKAQVFLEQSKKKDYYKILGISRNADQAQIKKAYRELAKIHHPDKVQGEEEKEKSNKIFQDIAEAYEVLSDDELRGKYDRGEEVFENQGGGGGSHGGPHWHFSHGGRPRHFQRTHVRFG